MFFLVFFLLFISTYAHKCSWNSPIEYEQIYLCRENLNSTSIRIWLHLKLNSSELNYFSYYTFTLRIIDGHKIQLKDRFEKQISDYAEIDFNQKDNNTLNIHNLSPGHYEICVNFFTKNLSKSYCRFSNSCLHIPWNLSEHEPHLFIHVLIIILLVAIVFFIYAVHEYFKSRERSLLPQAKNDEEDHDNSERVRLLVNQHFVEDTNPIELLVRRRIHQRYAHSFE